MDVAIRVLLVDDSPDFADLAADFLERDGFEVITATSAGDGLSKIDQGAVDCVVSDYEMPDLDGLEFLEAVREHHADLPFILFTGKGSEEIASEAISAGVSDYLQKGHGKEQYDLLSKRITNAVNQYRAEERAAHLERVNSVVREVDKALVRATAREDIEDRVCEIISRSDPYRFAWIADHDPVSRIVTPRASAGIEAGYLDEISVTTDDSPEGQGPIGRAIRSREIAVSQNVQEDPQFEPWREAALERGFQAVVGVPLIYDESIFGVLTVYADRPHAFDEDEQTLLAELGADIAHAIHALETTNRLRRNRDRIRAVMEAIPDFAIVFDESGRFEEVLAGPEDEFRTDPQDLIGQTLTDVIPADPASAIQRAISRTLATGEIQQVEYSLVLDETVHWFDARLTPLVSDLTRSQSIVFLARDITERKERERQLDTLITNLPGIVYRCSNEPEWPMELVRGSVPTLSATQQKRSSRAR
jgi:PAS domain S-box-containing protein